MGDLADTRTHGRRKSTVQEMSLASESLAAPMQLYVERLLPTCRIVWLYMLQVRFLYTYLKCFFSFNLRVSYKYTIEGNILYT